MASHKGCSRQNIANCDAVAHTLAKMPRDLASAMFGGKVVPAEDPTILSAAVSLVAGACFHTIAHSGSLNHTVKILERFAGKCFATCLLWKCASTSMVAWTHLADCSAFGPSVQPRKRAHYK